jgi:LAS superfamily LD-carboxypeptidase LdcB
VALLGNIKKGISAYTDQKKAEFKESALQSVYNVPIVGGIVEQRNQSKDKSFASGAKNYAAGKMKDVVSSIPIIGGIAKQMERIKRKEEGRDNDDEKSDKQGIQSFNKLASSSNEQVVILKKTNVVLTQISDNVYNIAGKLGAEVTSLKEVKQVLADKAKQEAIDKQMSTGRAEESGLESKQAVALGSDNKPKTENKKGGGIFDFLSGKLPIKDIIQTVLKGGLSFLKTAGGFLMRGLALFTNPIGIAVAIVGTIGYGIYKYFTDEEFKDSVDNLFEAAKKFIGEKFGKAKDLFSEYIVDPVINFLSAMKDKVIDWLVSVLKKIDYVPGVKGKIEDLEKMKSAPKASAAPAVSAQDQKDASSETDRLAKRYPAATDKQTTATPEQNAALEADITKYVNLKDSSIDLAGMDPAVKKRLAAVAYEYFNNTGKKIQINSAFRDPKEQAALFAKYGSPRAARPGKSKHEVGLAFDMNSADANQATSMGLFDKYGFQRPIAAEPWHVEAKEARNSSPDNPASPGQAVLVSNAGKPTIPSGGVAVNENQLKQAVPAGGGAETSQTASDLPSAEPVKTESGATTNMVTDSGSDSSAKSSAAPAEPVSTEPSSGNQVTQASMEVEQGYGNQQPTVSNIDNSSSSMNTSEQGVRLTIPSPVANRGSLDKMSFSYA